MPPTEDGVMTNWLCQFCGQYHDTTACPAPLPPSPVEIYESSGQAVLNGLTFGEHEICRRLDEILELLRAPDKRSEDG